MIESIFLLGIGLDIPEPPKLSQVCSSFLAIHLRLLRLPKELLERIQLSRALKATAHIRRLASVTLLLHRKDMQISSLLISSVKSLLDIVYHANL